MPLPVVAVFLPFAVLIALVVIWPRRHASRSSARLIAEAVAVFVLATASFYGTVTVLRWLGQGW